MKNSISRPLQSLSRLGCGESRHTGSSKLPIETGLDGFSAGNGSSVNMHGKANVSVFICLLERAESVIDACG